MPFTPWNARLRSLLGWFWLTPFEWAAALVIVGLVLQGAWPRYREWRLAELLKEEQYVVVQVRSALLSPQATQRACPAALDTCPDGSTSEECSFFSAVLRTPLVISGWRKHDGRYVGPAGGWYRYEPRGCQFLPVSAPRDTS